MLQADKYYTAIREDAPTSAIFSKGDADEWANKSKRTPKGVKLEGDVMLFVYFTVNAKGQPTDVNMIDMNPDHFNEIPKQLKAEANRLLKIMPKWSIRNSNGKLGGFMLYWPDGAFH
ncbi:MAG: hypothetical protein IJ527_02260 [Prevotella sp.]|nr:hypothetical protein [Prevotella sp.]